MRCHSHRTRGISIIECLVYVGVYVLLMGLGGAALYRCYDNFRSALRTSDDISRAVHAGEAWRADVRAATAPIQFNEAQQTLRIPRGEREVLYRLSDGQVSRKSSADAPWSVIVANVQSSGMEIDQRTNATAWRWDLELKARKKNARVKPLFTFIAATPLR